MTTGHSTPVDYNDSPTPKPIIIWLDTKIAKPSEYEHLKKVFSTNTDPDQALFAMPTNKDFDNLIVTDTATPVLLKDVPCLLRVFNDENDCLEAFERLIEETEAMMENDPEYIENDKEHHDHGDGGQLRYSLVSTALKQDLQKCEQKPPCVHLLRRRGFMRYYWLRPADKLVGFQFPLSEGVIEIDTTEDLINELYHELAQYYQKEALRVRKQEPGAVKAKDLLAKSTQCYEILEKGSAKALEQYKTLLMQSNTNINKAMDTSCELS
ncbi:unnamed protein product [Rotaria socialis]|uniref:Uncharacterized protein n=1 Tax=Rotaria socialis TaxID=392032 RepID=A0A821VTE4_9BILA|nr:unnamed protein product [Rotaria socialis]CAF4763599.1 unnamed protein product [Rotaria socialis]CAF4912898.1 unnamed protein product [Rotaria socialis]